MDATRADRSRIIVVHGACGSPDGNWFPWLAAELGNDFEVVIPRFPTPGGQKLDAWLAVFEHEIAPLRSTDVLVGHSIGAGFLIRVLERHERVDGNHVTAIALACGFTSLLDNDEVDPINATIIEGPVEWSAVRSRAGAIRAWHGAQHTNAAAGHTAFPELATFIRSAGT